MINNPKEIDMSDDQIEVREDTARVLLGALCASLATAIGLVWGLDWRVFWTVLILAIAAVIVAAALDNRRKERAQAEAEERARQEWRTSPWNPFRNAEVYDPKGQVNPVKDSS